MIKNLLDKLNGFFLDSHRHCWYRVNLFIRKEDMSYMHEKYYCEHCDKQMHIIRHWDRIPKLTITKRKSNDKDKQ